MKFIKLDTRLSRTELIETVNNTEFVNDKVKFDDKKGKPKIHVKDNGKRVKLKCEMIGGPTKDNGFLEGTYFVGSFKESPNGTRIRGIILTAPIYHTMLLLLAIFYAYRCITLGAFNPVPLLLLIFSIAMFKGEFDKQGTIERYLHRAIKRAEIKKFNLDR